jgi:hypothetical protein
MTTDDDVVTLHDRDFSVSCYEIESLLRSIKSERSEASAIARIAA